MLIPGGAEPVATTDAGIPVSDDGRSLSVGADGAGPLLLHDHHLVQKLAHLNRERVPERVVHAKGGGAYGWFVTTGDVSELTSAALFKGVGTRTPVFVRFSTAAGERGSADTVRDVHGFAVKFYTVEGNYDLVGNNMPVFFLRDPARFADLVHARQRMPGSGLRSHDAQWDFWTRWPETTHQVALLMSDRGTPRSWRQMHGFGNHTFMWINAAGERHWVKYHWKSEQGIANLTSSEARAMAAEDPDFHVRDLREAILRGEHPAWRLEVQMMPFGAAGGYRFNPFDVTKVWPHADHPRIVVGRLVLDRTPSDAFAEVEQAAFAPGNMVPGIGPSPDRVLLGRIFSYPDAHRYRIGTNHLQLPINRPRFAVHSSSRDGAMRLAPTAHDANVPDGGRPRRAAAGNYQEASWFTSGDIGRFDAAVHPADSDTVQATSFWRDVLDDGGRERLVGNVLEDLRDGVEGYVQERAIAYWANVAADLGERVARGLGLPAARHVDRISAPRL